MLEGPAGPVASLAGVELRCVPEFSALIALGRAPFCVSLSRVLLGVIKKTVVDKAVSVS